MMPHGPVTWWVSCPGAYAGWGWMTVAVECREDGTIWETNSAWPEQRGWHIDELLRWLRGQFGDDVLAERLR